MTAEEREVHLDKNIALTIAQNNSSKETKE